MIALGGRCVWLRKPSSKQDYLKGRKYKDFYGTSSLNIDDKREPLKVTFYTHQKKNFGDKKSLILEES